VDQVIECLLCKHKALGSNPSLNCGGRGRARFGRLLSPSESQGSETFLYEGLDLVDLNSSQASETLKE
jgi:hypothetical protein